MVTRDVVWLIELEIAGNANWLSSRPRYGWSPAVTKHTLKFGTEKEAKAGVTILKTIFGCKDFKATEHVLIDRGD